MARPAPRRCVSPAVSRRRDSDRCARRIAIASVREDRRGDRVAPLAGRGRPGRARDRRRAWRCLARTRTPRARGLRLRHRRHRTAGPGASQRSSLPDQGGRAALGRIATPGRLVAARRQPRTAGRAARGRAARPEVARAPQGCGLHAQAERLGVRRRAAEARRAHPPDGFQRRADAPPALEPPRNLRSRAREALIVIGFDRRRTAATARRQLAWRQQLGLDLDRCGHEDRGVELLERSLLVPVERALVVLGDLEHEVIEAVHAREVVQLLERERAHTLAVIIGMDRELVDEQRPHVALLEVARVDPVIRAGHFVAALGVRDDIVADLEQELLDALLFEDLLEPAARARPLVLDGLRVHVAEADLQEVPDIADIAAGHVPDVDRRARWFLGRLLLALARALLRRSGFSGRLRRLGLTCSARARHRGREERSSR